MKPPGDIEDTHEMVDIVTSELDIDKQEIESIIGRVFIVTSDPDNINADIEKYIDIIINGSYREAVNRAKLRDKYNSEDEVRSLREKKGGILKQEYPDVDPDKWKAKCEGRYCRIDYVESQSKVDNVICPVCSRELFIEPF